MGALSFLLGTVADLYMLCFVIRLALYWHGSDPRNPVASVVLRLTNPVVLPMKLLVKPSRRLETHVLVTFVVLQCLLVWLTARWGCLTEPGIVQILAYGLIRAVRATLWFYLLAVVAWALLSWFSPSGYNPVVGVLHRVCTPALAPIRRILPGLGGIDFSPLVFILAVQLAMSFLPGPEVAVALSCSPGFSPI
ncbi:MAG: YggT family protein [Gammaproteobacteria bacterium]|nr:YggT family protein [Gammaproteobacteria bacterium]